MYLYCVYFTTYSGRLLPPFYIGSTSVSKIEKGYRGSVQIKIWKNIWMQELKEHPELFHTEIVSYHETRKQAYDFEEEYHREEDVVKNPLYINGIIANKHFTTAGLHLSQETKLKISKTKTGKPGKLHSEETKLQMRESRKKWGGRAHTEEAKQKIRMARTGTLRDEVTKQKIGEAHTGKIVSKESRQRISDALTGKPLSVERRKNLGKCVLCVELDKVFDNCSFASEFIGITRGAIADAARGKTKTAKGYTWKFI